MKSYKEWLAEAFTSSESKQCNKIKVKHGLLVIPYTIEASRKYGMNTKWCISSRKDDLDFWNAYIGYDRYTPYFLIVDKDYDIDTDIDKEEFDLSKIAILIRSDGTYRVFDAKDNDLYDHYGWDEIKYTLNDIGVNIDKLEYIEFDKPERSEDNKTYIKNAKIKETK